jgi:hypothetical protein
MQTRVRFEKAERVALGASIFGLLAATERDKEEHHRKLT